MKSISFLISAYNDEKTISLQITEAAKIGNRLHIPFNGSSAFTDAELVIKAARLGYTIHEVSIGYRFRKHGTRKGGSTIWEMVLLYFGFL